MLTLIGGAVYGDVAFGAMHPCLEHAATHVSPAGGTCVLANMSTGSYWAWGPGDVPLRIANSTLGASGSLPYRMAVLSGIGCVSHSASPAALTGDVRG